jgi:tetratricopeptide (TPR) repeat protein
VGREGAVARGGRRRSLPRPVVDELRAAYGEAQGERVAERLADASYAYERERYGEALRVLQKLRREAPDSPAVIELYGLTLYRLGEWRKAAEQIELFRRLTGSYDQHPVLADCYRAMGRYKEAEALWDELRRASPGGDLVAEGRIVAAECRADQGDLAGAIKLLRDSLRPVKRAEARHLRQWYALADLYDRSGDLPQARELFERVASVDAEAFDVRGRLRSLR